MSKRRHPDVYHQPPEPTPPPRDPVPTPPRNGSLDRLRDRVDRLIGKVDGLADRVAILEGAKREKQRTTNLLVNIGGILFGGVVGAVITYLLTR